MVCTLTPSQHPPSLVVDNHGKRSEAVLHAGRPDGRSLPLQSGLHQGREHRPPEAHNVGRVHSGHRVGGGYKSVRIFTPCENRLLYDYQSIFICDWWRSYIVMVNAHAHIFTHVTSNSFNLPVTGLLSHGGTLTTCSVTFATRRFFQTCNVFRRYVQISVWQLECIDTVWIHQQKTVPNKYPVAQGGRFFGAFRLNNERLSQRDLPIFK